MPQRMPWLFRTTLDIRLPFTSTTKTKTGTPMKPKPAACRQTAASMSSAAGVTAHIWSDKEAAKSTRIFSAKDRNHQAPPSEHGAGGSGTFVVQIGIRRSSENVHVSEKK